MLPGDALRVRRGLYWHYGLYAGEVDGKKMVFENTRENVKLVSLDDFSKGKEIESISYLGSTKRDDIIRRANSILGKKKYSLLRNNCEHFVAWCQEGKPKSLQVRKGAKILAGTLTVVGTSILAKKLLKRMSKTLSIW